MAKIPNLEMSIPALHRHARRERDGRPLCFVGSDTMLTTMVEMGPAVSGSAYVFFVICHRDPHFWRILICYRGVHELREQSDI